METSQSEVFQTFSWNHCSQIGPVRRQSLFLTAQTETDDTTRTETQTKHRVKMWKRSEVFSSYWIVYRQDDYREMVVGRGHPVDN